jgi:hypothetical protein
MQKRECVFRFITEGRILLWGSARSYELTTRPDRALFCDLGFGRRRIKPAYDLLVCCRCFSPVLGLLGHVRMELPTTQPHATPGFILGCNDWPNFCEVLYDCLSLFPAKHHAPILRLSASDGKMTTQLPQMAMLRCSTWNRSPSESYKTDNKPRQLIFRRLHLAITWSLPPSAALTYLYTAL